MFIMGSIKTKFRTDEIYLKKTSFSPSLCFVEPNTEQMQIGNIMIDYGRLRMDQNLYIYI